MLAISGKQCYTEYRYMLIRLRVGESPLSTYVVMYAEGRRENWEKEECMRKKQNG